jgi:hypothetical protein
VTWSPQSLRAKAAHVVNASDGIKITLHMKLSWGHDVIEMLKWLA